MMRITMLIMKTQAVQRQRDMRLNEEAAKEKLRLIELMREGMFHCLLTHYDYR